MGEIKLRKSSLKDGCRYLVHMAFLIRCCESVLDRRSPPIAVFEIQGPGEITHDVGFLKTHNLLMLCRGKVTNSLDPTM
jgi:hypothetical protein